MLKMSSCKDIAISQQDLAAFAPSWQAGVSGSQCLPKCLKNIDVESVNIAKTCDNLSLALNENMNNIRFNSRHIEDDGRQCAIKDANISFRDFSNIWFGTLKIYRQQVNTLFRSSQDLLARSVNYKETQLKACKRRSSFTSQELIKKRRLTFNESSKESYLTTNYAKLLDELEKLARESTLQILPEDTQSVTGSITQYRIREITMREISATTFIHSDELGQDSGFGEATHEEIAEFLNFVGDEDTLNTKRMTLKRKLTYVEESLFKKSCLMNDHITEPMNRENVPFDEQCLKMSPSKRSTFPTHCLYEDTKNIDIINFLPHNIDTNDVVEADKIKKETMSDIGNTSIYNCEQNERRKLIIDACIKIDISDVIKTMKSSECFTKRIRKRTIKSFKTKRNILAFELLTRFNRRSLRLSLSLKQKLVLSREQFKRDYLNLLREIFKNNYKEEWASEIYPKWIYFDNGRLKQNKQQCLNKSRRHKTIAIQPDVDVHDLRRTVDYSEEIPTLGINNNKIRQLNISIYGDWRPYGVIMKLLNLWRSHQTNKIAAYILFKLANNTIERGLGFNSLLHLSKKRFVNLTSYPGSIELQNIEVGNNI